MTVKGKGLLRAVRMLVLASLATTAQILLLSLAAWDARAQESTSGDGAVVYQLFCASCHEGGVARAAPRATLGKLSAESVQLALTQGSMMQQAASLTPEQRAAVIRFLASDTTQQSRTVDSQCVAQKKPYTASMRSPHWNGWGNSLEQTRFQTAREARLAPDQVPRLKLKWAFGLPDAISASSQPAVVDGRVFVGSTGRKMYSLDAKTGCTHWEFATEFPVRTAITVGKSGRTAAVFFGDQHGRAYALDAATGKLLWKTRVEDYGSSMITGSPSLVGKILLVPVASNEDLFGASPTYECCKFRGSLSALDAATGKVLWKSYTVPEEPKPGAKNKQGVQLWGPSGAGVWSSPTVDSKRGVVYVTTGNSHSDPTATTSDAFVAFDLKTGRMLWSQQMTASDSYTLACDLPEALRTNCPAANGPDHDFSSSGILMNLGRGRRALIAGQKSGVVHALDPGCEWQGSLARASWQRGPPRRRAVGFGHRRQECVRGPVRRRLHRSSARITGCAACLWFGAPVRSESRGRAVCARRGNGRRSLEHAASGLRYPSRLQPGSVRCSYCDSRHRVLGWNRRRSARLCEWRWKNRVGDRHHA